MQMNRKTAAELLLPVGEPALLSTAIRYGADAVYIGGASYSLRAKAPNFSDEELAQAIETAHAENVLVYITVNIFAHEPDLEGAASYFRRLGALRPDGLLIADPGLFRLAKRYCPEIPLHISTQANNVNSETVRFWAEQGARRVVLGRELSLEEIRQIRRAVPRECCELEVFVHGAMCMSYSGRCLLSNAMTGRDANRGDCAQPCRWRYALMEETRPGEFYPIEETGRGTTILSSGDLCMIDHLEALVDAGVDSLKVEGRMKNALYLATVGRAYRRALDMGQASPACHRDLSRCTHRPYTTGFFFGKPGQSLSEEVPYEAGAVYLGTVQMVDETGMILLEQKNKFSTGETLTVLKPDGTDVSARILEIRTEDGTAMESAPHPKERLWVRLACAEDDAAPEPGDVLCRDVDETGINAGL